MIRSYQVEVALALGGVEDAVVLKDIAYWCNKNGEEHDGRNWMFKSITKWKEDFPEFQGRIDKILRRLEAGGWVLTGTYNKHPFDRTKWYAVSDKCISLFGQMQDSEEENSSGQSDTTIQSEKKPSNSIEEILKRNAEIIDHLYSLYPGKTDTKEGVRSTGKCSKDKHRLAALLRDHTPEQIERSITKYIEEQGGRYLKNFSTFLNNLPEYEEDLPLPSTREERVRVLGYQSLE